MNNQFYKSFITFLVMLMLPFGACELFEMDKTKDPNALVIDQAKATPLLNGIQRQFGLLIANLEVEPSETVRILNMDGRVYREAFEDTRFDEEWRRAYVSILNNIRLMTPIAEKHSLLTHLGIAQIIEAYTMMTLVDLFGDVPYSKAFNTAEDNFDPQPDKGASVYAAAMALLDKAIANFNKDRQNKEDRKNAGKKEEVPVEVPVDLFYGSNWSNWIKVANSLKMRVYVVTRLVDTEAVRKFDAIVATGNFIQDNSEDFQFEWGTNNAQPDVRHPRYVQDYTPSGASNYMSNWLMNYMYSAKSSPDPRMKYYFYRQVNQVSSNPNQINCVEEKKPAHYKAKDIFCRLPVGYWGRDHGDDEGIPPDGQRRTTYGLYPVGGKFDDNSFKAISSISVGAKGRGITPLMLASWVDIMRAEMALVGGNTGQATTLLENGVRKSFQKVRAFISRDPSADLSAVSDPTVDDAYVRDLATRFSDANNDGKMDILGAEYFVILFGNGLEAFNFYRRTGRPSTLQPNLEQRPGDFFRSFLYPANAASRNKNITQKSNVLQRVFWDTGMELLAN